jgi:hypothetical protein
MITLSSLRVIFGNAPEKEMLFTSAFELNFESGKFNYLNIRDFLKTVFRSLYINGKISRFLRDLFRSQNFPGTFRKHS